MEFVNVLIELLKIYNNKNYILIEKFKLKYNIQYSITKENIIDYIWNQIKEFERAYCIKNNDIKKLLSFGLPITGNFINIMISNQLFKLTPVEYFKFISEHISCSVIDIYLLIKTETENRENFKINFNLLILTINYDHNSNIHKYEINNDILFHILNSIYLN